MLTPDIMMAAGYHKFSDPRRISLGDWYRGSYQKRISDQDGTRYFITVSHSVIPAHAGSDQRQSFTPDTQFYRGGTTFDVEMLHNRETLEQVEAFFDEMWTTMRLDYREGGGDRERGR